MTLDFYNLKEEPFGFLPDSRFVYLSSKHRQALASLLLALQGGRRFVTLMAQPGLGKTTLLFHTLNSFGDRVATVYLFQAPRTPVELLQAVLTDLGVRENAGNLEGMIYQLRAVLLETHRMGKRVVIVIDEAQNLDSSIFYPLCALSNLSTLGDKLIQFVLCGQPSLCDKLSAIEPIQSTEQVAAAHLEPFSAQDTAQYVDHRLRTAGYKRDSPLFTPEASALVAGYSQGTPRTINRLCFEALSTAYRHRRKQIGADTVHEAAANLDLPHAKPRTIVGSAVPPLAAPQVPVIEASALPAAPQQLASPVLEVLEAKQAVSVPAGWQSVWPGSRTFAASEKYVAAAPPVTRPQIAAEKASVASVLAPTLAKAREVKVLPVHSVLALPKGAFLGEMFQPSLGAASQARINGMTARTPVARPLPAMTLAAVLLAVTGAAFGIYRAQTVHPAAKQTVEASPLPYSSGSAAQGEQSPRIIAMEVKAAPAAIAQVKKAAPEHSPQHDLKGMDLQSALRALSTRKQRQQQDQATEGAQHRVD